MLRFDLLGALVLTLAVAFGLVWFIDLETPYAATAAGVALAMAVAVLAWP